MRLFTFLLVAAFLPAGASAQTAPGSESGLAGGEGAGEKSTPDPVTPRVPGTPVPVPLSPESRIVLEHLAGRSFLSAGSLPLLGLEQRGSRQQGVINFGDRRWPVADALFLRFPQREPPVWRGNTWIVLLRNGDTVRARIEEAPPQNVEDSLRLLAPSLGATAVKVPLAAITALIAETALYGSPGRLRDFPQARAQLIRRLERMKVEEDVVLLRQDAGASGPQGARIQGIVESVADQGVKISSERLGEVDVSYSRLKALVLVQLEELEEESPPEAKAAGFPPRVHLRLQDGGRLTAHLDALHDARASIRHGVLGRLEIALEHVAEIAFPGGRVSFLSDREPVHVHEVPGPLFNETDRYAYKRDANVLYGPLMMAGRIYRKGLGVHSYSLLEYALEEDDTRFEATIGLDDSARPFSTAVAGADVASVVFRVKVDGNLLFEKAMTWEDAPVPVEVPVKGGGRLSLEVDFGGVAGSMNSTLDRADWADARVVKKPD